MSSLRAHLDTAQSLLQSTSLSNHNGTLPIGIGFINWGASLADAIPLIQAYRPAAVWFFAPASTTSLREWADATRQASPATKIWVQIGSVSAAVEAVEAVQPDVLVVQGTDAGGHGLAQGAGLITLLPEVDDAVQKFVQSSATSTRKPFLLAAGGISEGRTAAAAFTLGAHGIVMGTRFLASHEAHISKGYQNAILSASDGGQNTVRTSVYDMLRGTTGWPQTHNGRALINKSYTDALAGMSQDENKQLYEEDMTKGDQGWGVQGRMTTYAGSGIGLVTEVKGAADIVQQVRQDTQLRLHGMGKSLEKL